MNHICLFIRNRKKTALYGAMCFSFDSEQTFYLDRFSNHLLCHLYTLDTFTYSDAVMPYDICSL